MTDCWVNMMSRHAVHALHLHPLSVISGTYYVARRPARRASASRTRASTSSWARLPSGPTCAPENRQQVAYDVEAGKVILFESWMRHEVAAQRGRGERVSISFNYDWR